MVSASVISYDAESSWSIFVEQIIGAAFHWVIAPLLSSQGVMSG
jgi:hypothetical protein